MPDTAKTDAEQNAEAIRQEEKTQQRPLGNVHSEEEPNAPPHNVPPPLPN